MNTTTKSVIVLFMLMLSAAAGFAGNHQKGKDSTSLCLDIYGLALDENDQAINGVSVKLYKENSEMEWTEVTSVAYHDHAFNFKLEVNQYYTIEVSKDGYVTRSVGVSTNIPQTVSLKQIFSYEFEVQMFKANKSVDDFYLDFPVALVSYNAKNDIFDNNNNYTKHIKTHIKEAELAASSVK